MTIYIDGTVSVEAEEEFAFESNDLADLFIDQAGTMEKFEVFSRLADDLMDTGSLEAAILTGDLPNHIQIILKLAKMALRFDLEVHMRGESCAGTI